MHDPEQVAAALRAAIAAVPDFPSPGILFRDITPLLAQPALLAQAIDAMAAPVREAGVTHVAAIESRGFLLGAPLALTLGAALVPLRKPGKLPRETRRAAYALEYGTDALEMHADALERGARVLLVDDVLATGGTLGAARSLVEAADAMLLGASVLIELEALRGRAALPGLVVSAVLTY
ncbi:MAG: adenine phosphoribosyltransferase [Gemmatimonadaceae bacterium]|jgi:adenine phosphoribosyltransferase|nr:adenine phosphoribosyltransferase [Gemmatimonadaceae bacterium]